MRGQMSGWWARRRAHVTGSTQDPQYAPTVGAAGECCATPDCHEEKDCVTASDGPGDVAGPGVETIPFTSVDNTDDLVSLYAGEIVDAVRAEVTTEGSNENPWGSARQYARARIETERARLYASVLATTSGPEVLLYNARELNLLAQLADSLELPR